MGNPVQDLNYNVTGQSFVLVAPEGRPSSITSVTVLPWNAGDDDTAETATTGSAAVDTNPNTTFDAASGLSQSNPKTCNLAATTGIEVGGEYLAVNAANESEWVEVVGITSGASVQGRSPLHNDYASSDTFIATRVTISVIDAWIQDSNKITDGTDPNPGWRIRWVYVVTPPGGSSQTVVRYTYADVVRVAGLHGVTPADMARFVPAWRNLLPTDFGEDEGQAFIDEGYQDVQTRLLTAGIPDQQIRNSEALNQIVKYAARYLLWRHKFETGGDELIYVAARDEYIGLLGQMFTVTSRIATGVGTSGSGTRTAPVGIWTR